MERRSRGTRAPSKTHRRRSTITIIVPGEEENPFQKGPVSTSNQKDHSTFESFKAKPRCPTPDFVGAAHRGEHVNETLPGVGLLPLKCGSSVTRSNGGVVELTTFPSTDQAPIHRGSGAPAVMSQSLPSPRQQQQPAQAPRCAVSSGPADRHLFSLTPPSTATLRRTLSSRREDSPVVAGSLPSLPTLLSRTPTETGTELRRGAAVSGVDDDRRLVASKGVSFNNAPIASSSEAVPRRATRRIHSSGRLPLNLAASNRATASENRNSDNRISPTTACLAAAPASPAPQNATVAIAAHGGASCLSSPKRPLVPPLRPNAMWNAAVQRQPFALSCTGIPSGATSSPRGDGRGVTHLKAPRRSTVPQAKSPREMDLKRVPRPPLRRPQKPPLAASRRGEIREAKSKGPCDRSVSSFSSSSSSERGNSDGSSSSSGSAEDSKSPFTGRDSSTMISDSEMSSAVSLASSFPAPTSPRQRCESPPAGLSVILASGMAAPLPAGRAAGGDSAGYADGPVENHLHRGSSSEGLVDLVSTTDFSVVLDSPRAAAATSELQRQPSTFTSPRSANGGRESIDRVLEEPSDASLSNFGLLPNDDGRTSNMGTPSALPTKVAPASLSSPQLAQTQERIRRTRDSAARPPSPVDLDSLLLSQENERLISSLLASSAKHRANLASLSGKTRSGCGCGANRTHGAKGGKGSVVVDQEAGSNLSETAPTPNSSMSSCSLANLSHTRKECENDIVDTTSGTKSKRGAFCTTSRGPARSVPNQAAAAAPVTASLPAPNNEKWSVTESLSIDIDLLSFSQLPPEKQGSTVAKLRNVFESSKEKRLRSSSNQVVPLAAARSLKGQFRSPQHANTVNGSNTSSLSKGSPPRKAEGAPREGPRTSERGVRSSAQLSISPKCQRSVAAAPSVANYSFSHLFPESAAVAKAQKESLPPLSSTAKSDGVSVTSRHSSGTDLNCSVTSSLDTRYPMARRTAVALQHEVSAMRGSSGALPFMSLQRSDPGFSLPCFTVSSVSPDTVNMFDRFDF
ncbi:hypothetical protein CUR178_02778 [Leishmania enriettii]|uniref:Uncharacterized protein n=1 Tax=Leishmania enriettii TaxID=5663 RepID=A0A836H6Y7_LEIEN|nr:hypothetical protein CUR178_02778 [Leishmania enriettii]